MSLIDELSNIEGITPFGKNQVLHNGEKEACKFIENKEISSSSSSTSVASSSTSVTSSSTSSSSTTAMNLKRQLKDLKGEINRLKSTRSTATHPGDEYLISVFDPAKDDARIEHWVERVNSLAERYRWDDGMIIRLIASRLKRHPQSSTWSIF
jgi:hypothetical protein